MDLFFGYALLMGFGFSILSAPIGSVMIWKRLSFFGDTIAHSTLLGVAISLFTSLDVTWVVLAVCIVLALTMMLGFTHEGRNNQPNDARLAMLSHGSLALGIIALSFQKASISQFNALLFGDILSITQTDLYSLAGLSGLTIIALTLVWRPFLTMILSEEIALSEGVPIKRLKAGFAICLGLTIGLTLKVIGALLMTALMIIPPLTARQLSRTPIHMIIMTGCLCFLSFITGLGLSFLADTPTGPSIVVSALGFYLVISLYAKLKCKFKQ